MFPVMLNQLLSRNVGFPWTVRAAAFLVLACLGAANLFIRPRAGLARNPDSSAPNISFKMLFYDLPYMLLILGCVVNLPIYEDIDMLMFIYAERFCRSRACSTRVCLLR